MKKILFTILLIVTSFGFASNVGASERARCFYQGADENGTVFQVLVEQTYSNNNKNFDAIVTLPSGTSSITIGDGTKNDSYAWYNYFNTGGGLSDAFKVVSKNNNKIQKEDLKVEHIENNGCYTYLYVKDGWANDDLYFSNDGNLYSDLSADIQLETYVPYKDTEENSVLKEMICTYFRPEGATGSGPSLISYIITPSKTANYNDDIIPLHFRIVSQDGFRLSKKHDGSSNSYGGTGSSVYINNEDFTTILDTRTFWYKDTGIYACPKAITVGYDSEYTSTLLQGLLGSHQFESKFVIGYEVSELIDIVDDETLSELRNLTEKMNSIENKNDYLLDKNASWIVYEHDEVKETGPICGYYRENDDYKSWALELQPYSMNNRMSYTIEIADHYKALIGNSVESINAENLPSNKVFKSCDELPEIYTNCLTEEIKKCSVSATNFSGSEKLVLNKTLLSQDASTVADATGRSTGRKYKRLLCELGGRLGNLVPSQSLRGARLENIIYYDEWGENEKTHTIYDIAYDSSVCKNEWKITTNYSCNDEYCKINLQYDTERQIKKIASYCNEIYDGITKIRLNDPSYRARINECIQFDSFYSSLVSEGIISDLTGGCNIASNDAKEIINDVLNIIKIAGPLIAIGLGMLDFAKAVVSGDADKEFKSAGQRFLKRIIAAIVLILLPVILSFIMNIFLKNQPGYNKNSPFCGFGTNSNNAQQSVSTGNVVKPGQNNQNPNGYVPVPR